MLNRRFLPFFAAIFLGGISLIAMASSHREAPLISNDPLADNTDLYAFVSPDNPNTVTIIANYIPFELPEGGPNYFSFGEGIRYEIHIRNQAAVLKPGNGDDITYRFTFKQTNEDATTFFNIRLGKQNLKTTYTCEKSIDGGATWMTIVDGGIVPPANIGPRSIEAGVGLNTPYESIWTNAITTVASGADAGTKVFCGPADDPFFVDLAGIFDLGNFRKDNKTDALAGLNCHTIALQIPISLLQKDGKSVSQATNILDGDFVIGVWASASRPRITTLSTDGSKPTYSDDYVQVSRLGMPLTNEAIVPIGYKDRWNATSPYSASELDYVPYFTNPELGLYIGNGPFGEAVGTLLDLRIDSNSLGAGFDFRNTKDGLFGLYATNAGAGTALDTNGYGKVLLQKGAPRSVDILPLFYTGAPNIAPYQLATGKTAGPLSAGKPFVHNFLPTLGDMLRLNMATPATPRTSPDFSSEGLIQAAVLGLTDARFNASTDIQNIPNMDGFPNGRRLEDDVTRIEMQAVGGLILNAIGLWTDDYISGQSPLTPQLLAKVTWNAGIDKNDVPFRTSFPYLALPHRGSEGLRHTSKVDDQPNSIGIRVPDNHFNGSSYPNPAAGKASFSYHIAKNAEVSVAIYDTQGRMIAQLQDDYLPAGDHELVWTPSAEIAAGSYITKLTVNGKPSGSVKIALTR